MIEQAIIAVLFGFQAWMLWLFGVALWDAKPTLKHGWKWLAGWCVELLFIVLTSFAAIIGAEVLKQWLLSLLR